MAKADYRLCDKCGEKAFYDANLNYEQGPSPYRTTPPFRYEGEPQYANEMTNEKHGARLDHLGDWAVLCADCAKKYKCIIVIKDTES